MNDEHRLTDRDMAIEGYGQDYKGVLPDGTVTGLMSYDGRAFKHYVESGEDTWRHPRWERDYEDTPLRTPLELLATSIALPEMHTDECVYRGTHYEGNKMKSCGMSGYRFDYETKGYFERQVLRGEITLPAPAVFGAYGNIYIETGHKRDVRDIYWNWEESHNSGSFSKTESGAD